MSIFSESNPFHKGPRREHLEVKAISSKLGDGDARAVDPTEVMLSVDVNSLCIQKKSKMMQDIREIADERKCEQYGNSFQC
ncbi:hypothetical protein DPMN_109517 [Dreissena polymorpha]|uniref:Uncharacterized protein n=1 Tax=Dreissena polymorpha TaxID=45954 RepID=A0A9D4QN05_DREPO|nr:hypothetical protein DPMN_109517 [Dreissena polymorpha]